MAQLESALVKSIQKKLKNKYGTDIWFYKSHGGPDQIRGLPDLIGAYRGYFVAMEVKKPGGKATDLQAFTMERMRLAGGYATTIHSFEEAVAFLDTVPAAPTGGRER